jgi:hypothetical protein
VKPGLSGGPGRPGEPGDPGGPPESRSTARPAAVVEAAAVAIALLARESLTPPAAQEPTRVPEARMAPDAGAWRWGRSLRASRRTGCGSTGVPQAWPALPRRTALRAGPLVALSVSRAARSATARKPAQPERVRAFGLSRVPGLAGPGPGLARVAETRASGVAVVAAVTAVAAVAATSRAVKMRLRVSHLQAPRAQPLHPR